MFYNYVKNLKLNELKHVFILLGSDYYYYKASVRQSLIISPFKVEAINPIIRAWDVASIK